MKGKIETSSTLSLPIVDKDSASPIIIPFGGSATECTKEPIDLDGYL